MSPGETPLTDSQRSRIDAICAGALALSPETRRAFVEAESGGDPRVIEETLAILAALSDDDFLEAPASLPPIEADARLTPEHRIGQHIGPYRVVRVLGEGGFAIVYLAEQEAPMRREVALKVIKPGMDSRAVVARFEAERQALAIMDHPGVARVFDGGATPDGVPYFVMELVRGDPITRWADRRGLTIARRLELFLEVCDAVQHAHQKGVIHRDLKPSNILIHERDGIPCVKVIDFGIAKALDEPLTGAGQMTISGQFVGTPEYMPPEQMAGEPGGIDTRTDVYALGVVLYELLCAQRPFDAAALSRTGIHDLHRRLREEVFTRPSVRAGRMSPEAAKARASDAESLARSIRGDLDWIAMTALAREREERYASVGALAAEIRRHLTNEPIEARPPSRAYRLSKFVRRHRVGVTVGGAIALLLIVSIATIITLGATALRQANRSARFAGTFLPALSEQDEESSQLKIQTIDDLLAFLAQKTDEQFADYEEDRAELHTGIGLAYLNRGRTELATEHFATVIALREASGADSAALAEAHHNWARSRWHAEDFESARAGYQRSLALLDASIPTHRPMIARGKQHLAATHRDMGQYETAEPLFEEALSLWRELQGERGQDYALTLYSLALLHQATGRHELAADECRQVLAIIEPAMASDALAVRRVRGTLAECEAQAAPGAQE